MKQKFIIIRLQSNKPDEFLQTVLEFADHIFTDNINEAIYFDHFAEASVIIMHEYANFPAGVYRIDKVYVKK